MPMATNRPVHGGTNIAELRSLGLRPEDVLDFSASINPLGVPPGVTQAMSAVDFAAYPDTECTALRESLAAKLGVPTTQILVGNGSTELIHLTARAYLGPGNTAAIFAPTFGEFEAACHMQDAQALSIVACEDNGFCWNIENAAGSIAEQMPSLVFLCNPNNPTGRYLGEEDVRRIASALPSDSLLLLDEAYLPFVDSRWDSLPLLDLGNVALLRSMTKDYALTALRLGYMLAPPEVVERVRMQQHSWSVNALAQAAGIAALSDEQHVIDGRKEVQVAKRYLLEELRAMGLKCAPPSANFVLVKVGDARGLRSTLLKGYHISVRDCTSFGLPDYIRVGIRTLNDCKRLVSALRETFSATPVKHVLDSDQGTGTQRNVTIP